MYMRVHFFPVCCFPAAGLGPLAAAPDPAAERARTCLCLGACPRLLLPLCRAQLGSFWFQELLTALWSCRGGDGCCGWHLCPACCWFTVMMLGRRQSPRVPAQAGDSPHLQAGELEKALSFLRNVFVFSLRAAALCPSPSGPGPSSSRVLCNSRALSQEMGSHRVRV